MNKSIDDLISRMKARVFEAIIPTYILDESYHALAWNQAFENIVAKPIKLERGGHITEFLNHCENRREALERSAKVFALGSIPKTDHELIVFRSPTYGKIEFQKMAAAVHFKKTDEIAWIVSLNIRSADKFDLLFNDMLWAIEAKIYEAG